MRILVTGGAGFLGSHLSDRLLAEGHAVVAMDNLITGNTRNIAHLAGRDDFVFIKHDVTNYIYVDGSIDAVLHFASPASPIDYLQLPIQTLKVGALGTHKTLGLAKARGARYLLASTSEVYGDPKVHPQTEDYWGHVNPIGPRGVYDEAKRFAEAMTMAYHRYHEVNTHIVRIFNSILADEAVLLFNSDTAHLTPIEEYAQEIENDPLIRPRHIRVPAFDPATGMVTLREATALIKHRPARQDAYLVKTRYGREIRVTGDHSVFRRDGEGKPEAVPVRELAVGEYVAIAARMPVVERDRTSVNLGEHYLQAAGAPDDLWNTALVSPALKPVIAEQRAAICEILSASTRFDGSRSKSNTVGCAYRKYLHNGFLPLHVFARLRQRVRLDWPAGARLRLYQSGARVLLPNEITISNDFLWFLGLFMAEGTLAVQPDKGTYMVTLSSHQAALDAARLFLARELGVKVGMVCATLNRAPSLYVHSKQLCHLLGDILGFKGHSAERRIPAWVFQLPLSLFKYFLEGYRAGDGTHSCEEVERKHTLRFVTVSKGLANDLVYSLLRFGIIASVHHYSTTITNREPRRQYPYYCVSITGLSSFDILTWDAGVSQNLRADRFGDLVWARITALQAVPTTEHVYDFSVPGYENFVAGQGIFAKNTYGPRMRLDDGRVVPNFVAQALRREPLTIYGDGLQSRSFTYYTDLIEGVYRLLLSEEHEPVNIGNPYELTVREFAELINEITGNAAGVVYEPGKRIQDDPQHRQPDISKARRVLGGWEPRVDVRDGLKETIEWFRKYVFGG